MKTQIQKTIGALALLALFILNPQLSTCSAQGTVFTYQGRVTDNGTNFTGLGQFKFALVTSTNLSHPATATANMGGTSPNEFVNGYTIISGGSGYVTAPAVTVSAPGGSGSTATATATITGGSVTAINIISPGSGYSSTPTVTIAPPSPNISYTTYWSNDGTSVNGSEPGAAVNVNVNNGLFTVTLGDTTLANMAAINVSLFAQPNLQLRIWFNDGINGFAALDPAQNLTPTPYAAMAENTSNLVGNLPAAQLSGTIPAAQLNGVYSNATVELKNVDGSLPGGTIWEVTGNNSYNWPYFNDSVVSIWNSGQSPALRLVSAGSSTPSGALAVSANNLTGPIAIFGNANAFVTTIENSGAIDAPAFNGSGAGLTSLNANNLASGTVPGGRLSGTYSGALTLNNSGNSFAGNGSGLTSLNASQLASGVVPSTVLPGFQPPYQTVSGGTVNSASGSFATVAGGQHNTAGSSSETTVGGGQYNTASGDTSTVGGGGYNTASGTRATVSGGVSNVATSQGAAVSGGEQNVAGGYESVVSGGYQNNSSGYIANIGGGNVNTNQSNEGAIAGGQLNQILQTAGTVYQGTIGGGYNNLVTNSYATVPGGAGNVAGGEWSFAAGRNAQAVNQGAFVWADSQNTAFSSTANDQFLIRAQGGVGIDTGTTVEGSVTINTNIYLDDHAIYLRGNSGSDHNHGLGYNGQTVTNFGGGNYQVDGPALWGYNGGVLGTRNGGDHGALVWNQSGVTVNGNLGVTGNINGHNTPAVNWSQSNNESITINSTKTTIANESSLKSAPGYFVITAFAEGNFNGNTVWLELYDTSTTPATFLTTAVGHPGSGNIGPYGSVSLSWVVPITTAGGYENFSLQAYTDSGTSSIYSHNLTVMYFPKRDN